MTKIIEQFKKLCRIEKLKNLLNYFKDEKLSSDNLNTFMKKKQNLWGCVVLATMLILFLILHAAASSKSHAAPKPVSAAQNTDVDGVVSSDFTQKDTESALQMQQQEYDHLSKKVDLIFKAKVKSDKAIATSTGAAVNAAPLPSASQSSADVNNANQTQPESNNALPTQNDQFSHPLTTLNFHYQSTIHATQNINTSSRSNNNYQKAVQQIQNTRTPKTWVPAGTFSRVVLLEGADANASVNGQSDTVPILMRFLDQGTLPNGFHSHLKGCFALASIYGDISSERGEARLNKLTCTKKDGSILEIPVQGYISFAGKEGIRGTPVMRNGQILTMAGISGALSGFGSALAQSQQTQSISPLGVTSTVGSSQVLQSGAYTGASTAMGELASYYIKRADQYHPIISIGSGTVATVIFQTGFSLVPKVNTVSTTNSDTNTNNSQNTQSTQNNNNNTAEVKALLQQAQTTSQLTQQNTQESQNTDNQTSPFSNVSQTAGQLTSNTGVVGNVTSN